MPETATLELVTPPGVGSAEEFRARVTDELAMAEERIGRELALEGRSFLGRTKVLAQKPCARPSGGEPRRALNPRVAARDKWKRIEALSRLVEFLRAYRAAWRARRSGHTDALFPAGTYLLRIVHNVPCAMAA
jgi:hypothetical protein